MLQRSLRPPVSNKTDKLISNCVGQLTYEVDERLQICAVGYGRVLRLHKALILLVVDRLCI